MIQFLQLIFFIIFGKNEGHHLTQDMLSAHKINSSTSPFIPTDACRIGRQPRNGWVENTNPPFGNLSSDDYVNSLTSVTYKCKENHFIDEADANKCSKGKWINSVPECKPFCNSKDISSYSIIPTMCFRDGVKIQCSDPAVPGTTAILNCRDMYQRDSGKSLQVTSCGADGAWAPPPQQCSISCGIVSQNVTRAPWNARVQCIPKDSYALGTIINARMVLSVATHFWNPIEKDSLNLSEFYVDIERNNLIYQQIEIERIAFAPNHMKFLRFPPSGNIVLVVLRVNIEFKSDVTPICLPFELNNADDVVTRSSFEGRTPQQENIHLQIPTNCYSEWNSTDKRPVLATDILCTDGLKLSTNDIFFGSSFAVPIKSNSGEVFYLLGIHTWITNPAGSDQGTYFQFQNTLFYEEFIQNEISYENEQTFKEENATITSLFRDEAANSKPLPDEISVPCGIVTQNTTKTPWNARVQCIPKDWYALGTIINARMVLSVATHFWNPIEKDSLNLSEFYVETERDNIIYQQIEVERIAFAPNHMKFLRFPPSGNIVLVVLRTSIKFRSYVTPICLPFDLTDDVVTRGSFEGRTPQQENVHLQIPTNCYSEWNSTDQKPVLAIDVLCTDGLKLTSNDIFFGSSFAAQIKSNSVEVFYLLGIHTWNTIPAGMDQGTYFQFQNVLFYKEFIQNEISYENENSIKREKAAITYLFLDKAVNNKPPPEEPTCGIVTQNTTKTPWNARVQCIPKDWYALGTIISARIILSIAKYFWDPIEQERPNISQFYVDIERDNIIYQQIEIERIAYAPNHNKFQYFPSSGNIIVVVLRTNIEFESFVSPICLPFELYNDSVTLSSFKGRTPQQDNLELQLPTNCYSELNSTEKARITTDLANDILCTNWVKLTGDDILIGSSYAVPIETNGSKVFYLLGIRTWYYYDPGFYFYFQNVQFYKDFILSEISYEKEKYSAKNTTVLSTVDLESRIVTSTIANSFVSTTCRADIIPKRGNAHYESNDQKIEFGEIIQEFVGIVYRCIENHVLNGNSTNLCLNGNWIFPEPECIPRCNPKEIEGWTIVANCQFQEDNVLKQTSCNEPAVPGAVAYINCQHGYERLGSNQQTAKCGSDGRWNPLPEKCTPVCGEITQSSADIADGKTNEISESPWYTGIYRKYRMNGTEQVCGGSIISAKVIISAIRCFWDPSENKMHNKEEYHVAVGKSRRQFNEPENLKPQFFKIESIFYDEGYIDYAGYYANDIAVVVLDKFIEFKSYIAPVCIQFGLEYDDKVVQPGLIGKVAGWGLGQASGQPTSMLKEIELPAVNRKECSEHSALEFRPFITSDKFCAGYLAGIGVCQGDSGGGLVFPQSKGFKTVYFLRGILSTRTNKECNCDYDKYFTFTNAAYYSDLIQKYYLEFQPDL